jgi:hypothetical protein
VTPITVSKIRIIRAQKKCRYQQQRPSDKKEPSGSPNHHNSFIWQISIALLPDESPEFPRLHERVWLAQLLPYHRMHSAQASQNDREYKVLKYETQNPRIYNDIIEKSHSA